MDDEVLEELRRLREEVAELNRNFERLDLDGRSRERDGRGAASEPRADDSGRGAADDRRVDDSGRGAADHQRVDDGRRRAGDSRERADERSPADARRERPLDDQPRDETGRAPDRAGQPPHDPDHPPEYRSDASAGGPDDRPPEPGDPAPGDHPGADPAGAARGPGAAGTDGTAGPAPGSGAPPGTASQEPTRAAGPADPEPVDPESGGGRDWERSVGTKWLGIVGAFALVLGVVFFARVAIDRGYIGPLARVALGTAGGLALVGVGRYAGRRPDYRRWGQIASGAGLAVAYFSVYAAYGADHYREAIGTPPAAVVVALTALVAGAVAVSIRDEQPLFAGEAFLLGYVTTIVAPEVGTPLLTPAYVLLVTAGLVTVSVHRDWDYYVALGVVPAYLALLAWSGGADPGDPAQVVAAGGTFACYVAGGYALDLQGRDDQWFVLQRVATTVVNAGFAAIFLEVNVRGLTDMVDLAGAGTGVVAAVLVALHVATVRRPARRNDAAGLLGALLAVPAVGLAFEPFGTTIGLLAVVCAAVGLARAVESVTLRSAAHGVAAVTLLQVLFSAAWRVPSADLSDPVAALTSRAVAIGAAAVVSYGLAALWQRTDPDHLLASERDVRLAAPYAVAGTGLATLAIGLELSGSWITLGWALLGLALVGLGLHWARRALRLQGMAVLGLATLKVFVFDTAGLDLLARTASFLVLGAILLATSYAYARWLGEDLLGGDGEGSGDGGAGDDGAADDGSGDVGSAGDAAGDDGARHDGVSGPDAAAEDPRGGRDDSGEDRLGDPTED